ncbi:MAG: hypothetical protein LBG52_03445 [Candidatus Peribacteria bacterium]|jgi:hypothetical protein|nr:hypothetical protein [Candidatus Peribacteria bacterium]
MQFSFGTIYDFLDSLTTTINNMSTTITHSISDGLNTTAETSQALVDIVQACIDNPNPEQCKTNAKQGRDTTTNTWKQGRDTTTNTRKQGRNTTSNSPEEGDIQQ